MRWPIEQRGSEWIFAIKKLVYTFQVKAILVNVFGGIVNCTTISNGIVNAAKNIKLQIPIVARLEGESALP